MYRLSFAPAAEREWDKLVQRISPADYEALEVAIQGLASDPRPTKALRLVGRKDAYRLRVRDYRIIYRVNDPEGSVVVARVARRSGRTYRWAG